MFYQRPKPTLLTVNMPALDGGQGGGVRVLQRENTGDEASLPVVHKAATRCPFQTTVRALKDTLCSINFY